MTHIARRLAAIFLTGFCLQAQALEMAEEEFAAASELTCVLAQDALGYLSADDFAEMTSLLLEDFSEAERNAITAKSIGYVDGLMFGLGEADHSAINGRYQAYLESRACTRFVGVGLQL